MGPPPNDKEGKKRPPKVDPQEKTCECGNKFFDFVAYKNGGFNQKPYVMCRDCAVGKPRPRTRKRVAANKKGDAESDSGDEMVVRAGAFRIAPLAVSIATECPSSHPRLPVAIELPSKTGPVTVRVSGAVADSGAQVSILPARMLRNKGPVTFSPNHSRTDVRGADDSPLDVVGVVPC